MQAAQTALAKSAPVGLVPSAVFGLLASMYLCKPTADAILNWRDLMADGVPQALRELNETLGSIDVNSRKEMQDLLWDFTRLFIGPYRLPCPPWESVYRSQQRLLLQEQSDAVRAAYSRSGMKLKDSNVLPDHIGAELNFIGILLDKIEQGLNDNSTYQQLCKDFIEEHVRNWIPRFTSDMEKAAETALYKALAVSTRNVIHLVGAE
jgi:TorA maturation chaperone TorD